MIEKALLNGSFRFHFLTRKSFLAFSLRELVPLAGFQGHYFVK
ncbi:hypothetical protein SD77_3133 [Bacillus badius]|uniref:Uncharacterized protein n=1 Tax=Bacillus badius TaxID=1455 RepID=A0ABR5AX07_BACBA|nr:hypothetical protein SD78_0269 [Bacillus badius]KIL79267.1 hypothetical protein SD77_3133 [Bacillus badius]